MKLPVIALLFSVPALSGCFTASIPPSAPTSAAVTFESEFANARFSTDGPFSQVLKQGPHDGLPLERVSLTAHDGVQLAAALWRPDVPEGTRVPVVLMISPYFSLGLYMEDLRTKEFFIDSLLSHGYAFAKVAVRGTSYSGGCMESMGPNEQKDMDDIVTWFGEQAWSNGNVGIIGLSYVGTTPWAAAQWGNPHLKTIVPMSGVTSWFELGFRNGTSEPRTPIHMTLYWGQYGVPDPVFTQEPERLPQNLCEEPVWSVTAGPVAAALGEPGTPRYEEYWNVRDYRERVAANYNGSIFLVHGLRDWNVNIDMAVPFVTDLQAQGSEVKWLLGQWNHAWPDQVSRRDHVRYDFAEVLLRWFAVNLKGEDLPTGPVVDVEDSHGNWRTEETWPPTDVSWTPLHLGDGTLSWETTPSGSSAAVNPAGAIDPIECRKSGAPLPEMVPGTEWRFAMGPLETELRFAGPVRFHATVTPLHARGGEMYAELWEVSDAGWYRAAHGAMDLRFHKGGHEAQTILPGQPILALMEFYAGDVVIAPGSRLVLRVVPDAPLDPCVASPTNGGDIIQRPFLPGPSPLPLTLHWGDGKGILHLPVIQRDVGDGRYLGQPS